MIIRYDGQDYPFDMDDVGIRQALAIEKFMGCSFDEWGKKLQAGDLQARQALGWLILRPDSAGPLSALVQAIGDTDFKMVALGKALEAAFAAEAAAADAEPGPTGAAAASNGHQLAAAESSPATSQPSSAAT